MPGPVDRVNCSRVSHSLLCLCSAVPPLSAASFSDVSDWPRREGVEGELPGTGRGCPDKVAPAAAPTRLYPFLGPPSLRLNSLRRRLVEHFLHLCRVGHHPCLPGDCHDPQVQASLRAGRVVLVVGRALACFDQVHRIYVKDTQMHISCSETVFCTPVAHWSVLSLPLKPLAGPA